MIFTGIGLVLLIIVCFLGLFYLGEDDDNDGRY